MFLSLAMKELNSFAQLSLPFVIIYFYKPEFILSFHGAIFCSLLVGLRAVFIFYQQTNNLVKGLKFVPTGKSKEYFDKQIKEVGLNPDDVSLRYAYCDSNIALTAFNTIMIDQMIWKGFDEDSVCIEAQNVIKTHIEPALSVHSKKLHKEIKDALTSDAQKFIFKHELGHVVDNYSWKKIALNGVIGFLGMYFGFYVAQSLIGVYDGLLVFCLAITSAGLTDVSLSWLSNALFKAPKEKEADMFAVKYSSKQEIEAAANFFEKYERYAKDYRKVIGDTHSGIAPRFLMGYVPGKERVQYLRNAAQSQ